MGECGTGGRPADAGFVGVDVDEASGEDGDLTNMDFVPSTKRPPRGGPAESGEAKEDCDAPAEDGPAPGDCGGRGPRIGDDTPEEGPGGSPLVDAETLIGGTSGGPFIDGVALNGGADGGPLRETLDGGPDAGRWIGGLKSSSRGGM